MLLKDIRKRSLFMMRKTLEILENVLHDVSQPDATTYRDGDDGWTTLEVLCHLRDYDGFFRGRAEMILTQEYPELPTYDHLELVQAMNYNGQDLKEVLNALIESREKSINFFEGLTDSQWERAGVHAERGHYTITDAAIQFNTHDLTHIEQITRILTQRAR